MEKIFEELYSNKTCNTPKKQTNEITEEEIFGEETEEINMICRISELEKENRALIEENIGLTKQLHDLQADIQEHCLLGQSKQKYKAPAYKDNIKLMDIKRLNESGMSPNKIGKVLNCSPHTVKSRLEELATQKD